MGEANIDTLKRGYSALNEGDLSVVLQLLDPDIEWHEPAPSSDAGTHQGRASFERFLRGWLESFDEFRVEPERIVEQDDRLIAVVRQTGKGRASGLEIDATLAHVWTVPDGRAIRWEAVGEPEVALGDRSWTSCSRWSSHVAAGMSTSTQTPEAAVSAATIAMAPG